MVLTSDAWPAYSVLIPLGPWESAEVVADALVSVLAQTYPCSDLVISVDGRCGDDLMHAVKASLYPQPFTLLEAPQPQGVGPTLARGLLRCRCEFVMRMDADDLCLPDRAQRQLDYLLHHPDVVVVSAPLPEFTDEPSRLSGFRPVPREPAAVRGLAPWRNPINHPAVMFRRWPVLQVGNYRSAPGFEDYDLWLRLRWAGLAMANLGQPVVLARAGSLHRHRRRGLAYFRHEWDFYWRCGVEGLLPWPYVLIALSLRLPLRLLPPSLFSGLMQRLCRAPVRRV